MFSFWEKQWAKNADIVIVGAGFVGMQCAIKLKIKFPHRKVWIIDKNSIGNAASLRNAGFACFGSAGELLDNAKTEGIDSAIALYEKRYRGLQNLLQYTGETNAGYEKTGGYEIFSKNEINEFTTIESQLQILNAQLKTIHNSETFIVQNATKMAMNIHEKIIFTPHEGTIQTHLVYNYLYEKCLQQNIPIYNGMDVVKIEKENSEKYTLILQNHEKIMANTLVICTNGFTQKLFPDENVLPARGQVLVTSAIPHLAWRGLVHANRGYIYFRTLGTRILIGGGRDTQLEQENTIDMNITDNIKNYLVNYLKTVVIPDIPFILDHEWAGIMGMGNSKKPIVKKQDNNLYFCVRMGGMGVALSAMVSEELALLVE